MPDNPSNRSDPATGEMERLRELLLGKGRSEIKQVFEEHAREVVSEIFSEALHDRQNKDGSVNKVLTPLVEKSVEKSVETHTDQFVGYLYPLVGSLVRKSVTAFLSEFLAKTNELLENSLTIRGLKWRYKAWRTGVSFSQYVASQTFVFRIEQVLLIHRETGLLLRTVARDEQVAADADLVSSMLTAINDFVSDSFSVGNEKEEQQLSVVQTDDFTLAIKQGPQAILVAAVTGNMPPTASEQLQVSLEDVHRLYGKDLTEFSGDSVLFENSEQQLRDCLMSELKEEHSGEEKPLWKAWILVAALFALFAYFSFQWWQTSKVLEVLAQIDDEPGVIIQSLEQKGINDIYLAVLRDPRAINLSEWLEAKQLSSEIVKIEEQSFLSMDERIINLRVREILTVYQDIRIETVDSKFILQGSINERDHELLQQQLVSLIGSQKTAEIVKNLEVTYPSKVNISEKELLKKVFEKQIADITKEQIRFGIGTAELDETSLSSLQRVHEEISELSLIAEKLNSSFSVLIIGASDQQGQRDSNNLLSQRRAEIVEKQLIEFGVDADLLHAFGIGELELTHTGGEARKVVFSVVHF